MSKTMKGTLMTLIAGIAWGLSGVSGQYLMVHGFSAIELTNLRLLFSGIVLILLSYVADKEKFLAFAKNKSSYLPLLIFAFLGLLLTQLTYLEAIAETNAGTATVLQYLCPVGILAYTCIMDKVAPLNLIKKWGSMLVIGVGMTIPGILMLPFSGLLSSSGNYRLDTWMALFGLVVIGTIFAYTAFLKGTSLVGAVKGSLLASFEPVSAVFFAFVIMKEHFFMVDVIGMAMILLAVLLISLKDFMIQKEKGIL